jgi:hypothetical protein
MSIRPEVLVGKVLYEYYRLPKETRNHSSFLETRRKTAEYYIKNSSQVKDFIHGFRETKDSMKNVGEDGVTTMVFVLGLLKLGIHTKQISDKLNQRDLALIKLKHNPTSDPEKNNRIENNFNFFKINIKKGLKKMKSKISYHQYQLNLF